MQITLTLKVMRCMLWLLMRMVLLVELRVRFLKHMKTFLRPQTRKPSKVVLITIRKLSTNSPLGYIGVNTKQVYQKLVFALMLGMMERLVLERTMYPTIYQLQIACLVVLMDHLLVTMITSMHPTSLRIRMKLMFLLSFHLTIVQRLFAIM